MKHGIATLKIKKKRRIATLGIAEELRAMRVGQTVLFPIPKYNYNSIRSSPGTTLYVERIEGKRWKTRLNIADKVVEVTRLS